MEIENDNVRRCAQIWQEIEKEYKKTKDDVLNVVKGYHGKKNRIKGSKKECGKVEKLLKRVGVDSPLENKIFF